MFFCFVEFVPIIQYVNQTATMESCSAPEFYAVSRHEAVRDTVVVERRSSFSNANIVTYGFRLQTGNILIKNGETAQSL